MHWPVSLPPNTPEVPLGKENRTEHRTDWDFTKTWAEMEKLLDLGLAKTIGVANFSTVNLEKLLETAKVTPAVNQTEIQPLLPQDKLNAFCTKHGIHQTAFGPLGGKGSTLHSNETVLDIAKAHSKTPAQVLLSWGLKRGWSVIPKSITEERIRGNLDIFDMADADVEHLNGLAKSQGRRFNRPNWGATIFHDDEGLNLL